MAISGFYGVIDGVDEVGAAVELARKLLAGGASVLQLRLKRAPRERFVEVARALRRAVTGAPFIINDRLDVALEVGADGVHLGQDDLPLAAARAAAGGRLIIGISTHGLEQVRAAAGADYLGYGPVYATSSKENPDPVQGVAALAAAVRAAAPTPVVAIGGITPARAAEVAAAGAAAACCISAVNNAPDVTSAARSVADAFRRA